MTAEVNWAQFNEYEQMLGADKFQALWQDFLNLSEHYWQELENLETSAMRYNFHNWRSNSKVFGMDAFAAYCSEIEEALLADASVTDLSEQITQSKLCFNQTTATINAYFNRGDN